jgi:hypothetical protein
MSVMLLIAERYDIVTIMCKFVPTLGGRVLGGNSEECIQVFGGFAGAQILLPVVVLVRQAMGITIFGLGGLYIIAIELKELLNAKKGECNEEKFINLCMCISV